MNKYSHNFLGCDASYEESRMVIFGVPYDSTTSFRAGTRYASRSMRTESLFGIETYSPYQDKDIEDIKVYDYGDMELAFGNSSRAVAEIEENVRGFLLDNKIPVMIGGEHLVTLGAVKAVADKYPDLHIIHFDAHLDLRDEILGENLSHGTVMRRIWDLIGDNRIYQFGIRSGMRQEFIWGKEHLFTNRYNLNGLDKVIKSLGDKPVYITLDLDVLDPSIMTGTGTPEAGGVLFKEMLDAIISMRELNVVGFDMVELSPALDNSGASTVLACKLLREMLLSFYKE